MGGRKGDAALKTRKQKPPKRRPLSAVIEEHEADDSHFPRTVGSHENHIKHGNKSDHSQSSELVSNGRESGPCVDKAASSGDSSTASSIPTVSTDEESSPYSSSSRKHSLKRSSGRRQALTPSFSPTLGRRGSGKVLTSGFRVHNDESTDSDDDTLDPSDMTRVRQTADRLHLSTRRPSVLQWKAQYVECPEFPLPEVSGNGDVTGQNGDGGEGGRWTAERTERINTALDWIINELQEMRTQDQQLARQLLTIRSDLHQLKLARSCEEHQDMLDDVQSELEELQEFADVLDLPVPTIADSPLKHLGVTRMNFSARRFSTC